MVADIKNVTVHYTVNNQTDGSYNFQLTCNRMVGGPLVIVDQSFFAHGPHTITYQDSQDAGHYALIFKQQVADMPISSESPAFSAAYGAISEEAAPSFELSIAPHYWFPGTFALTSILYPDEAAQDGAVAG